MDTPTTVQWGFGESLPVQPKPLTRAPSVELASKVEQQGFLMPGTVSRQKARTAIDQAAGDTDKAMMLLLQDVSRVTFEFSGSRAHSQNGSTAPAGSSKPPRRRTTTGRKPRSRNSSRLSSPVFSPTPPELDFGAFDGIDQIAPVCIGKGKPSGLDRREKFNLFEFGVARELILGTYDQQSTLYALHQNQRMIELVFTFLLPLWREEVILSCARIRI